MSVIVVCFLSALITLSVIARDGAIHHDMLQTAYGKICSFYVPLLSLIGAFFFTRNKDEHSEAGTSIEAFLFAIFVTSIWVVAPLLLLWLEVYIEYILADLEQVKPFGDTIALVAIGYYFSKSNQ